MNLSTLQGFFFGRRDAIERIAACPRAVVVGLLFVLSAGLAREYDAEDLLAEPYHVFLPLAASLATSVGLYLLLSLAARCWQNLGHWQLGYLRFLGLYWMTAPLAWLYAIPVERFLSPYDATLANLVLLAVVATWRVVLMVRVVAVLFRGRLLAAATVVLFFADLIVVPATAITSLSLIGLMGGIHLDATQRLVAIASQTTFSVGIWTMPVWFFGSSFVLGRGLLSWPTPERLGIGVASEVRIVSRGVWITAGWSIVVGLALLPLAQGEQQRQREVGRLFAQGEVRQAVEFMAEYERDDFPPHWVPPPKLNANYGQNVPPSLWDAVVAVHETAPPEWLSSIYREKLDTAIEGSSAWQLGLTRESESIDRFFAMLDSLPDQNAFAARHARPLIAVARDPDVGRPASDRLRAWLARNGVEIPPNPPPSGEPPKSVRSSRYLGTPSAAALR